MPSKYIAPESMIIQDVVVNSQRFPLTDANHFRFFCWYCNGSVVQFETFVKRALDAKQFPTVVGSGAH